MNRVFSFGLIGRIVLALALVFSLLIIINELTVTSVVQLTLKNAHLEQPIDSAELQQRKTALISSIRRPVILYTITAAIVSLLLASLAIHRIAVKPLRRMTQAFDDLSAGKQNVHVPVEGASEMVLLASNFNRMADTIRNQQSELEHRLHELERTASHLRNTQNDLVRAAKLASVGTLASGVAHEIGNPVTGVLGLIEALESETNPQTIRSYHALIGKEVRRIDKTIRDLLSYARPSTADAPVSTALAPVFTHVHDLVRVQKAFAQITVEFTSATALPLLAISKDDLTAVLVNLCFNAAQAIHGAGKIHISAELVKQPTDSENDSESSQNSPTVAVIHVKDTGPGVSAEIADHIFEPFFTQRRAGDGSGLGLAICQSVCERHLGYIRLHPEFQGGAHFSITLPIVKD
ncbi:MAG: HAMP domain-containing protein [Deltaproteobacteria bacterium]|nr:HAMP domain-containing protein [Deltaproteobacteria bacterium]MBN2673570.1 HAMP domain-containing protein [Deltaproteobacteria bacterium]